MNTARPRGRIRDITSAANPEIKAIKGLLLKKNRSEAGAFLVEGLKLVLDATDAGWSVRTLIVTKSRVTETLIARAVSRTLAVGGDVLTVPEKLLGAITRRDNPQSVVAVVGQKLAEPDALAPSGAGRNGLPSLLVALDRVRDPGNLGTILRTCDASGVHGVILIGDCVDPFSIETVRATMGSLFSVPLVRMDEIAFMRFAKQHGHAVIGSHLKGAVDYRTPDYVARPTILLMGNEQAGLSDALTEFCDICARIPQVGNADSLNLAVATALMVYEARRSVLTLDDAGADA